MNYFLFVAGFTNNFWSAFNFHKHSYFMACGSNCQISKSNLKPIMGEISEIISPVHIRLYTYEQQNSRPFTPKQMNMLRAFLFFFVFCK